MRIHKKNLPEHNPVLVFETSFEEDSWEDCALNVSAQKAQYFWASSFEGTYMFELCPVDNPGIFEEKARLIVDELNRLLGTDYAIE